MIPMGNVITAVRLHPTAIAALIVSDDVSDNMYVRGILVASAAKLRITETPKRVDTGRLRSDIKVSRITRVIGYPRRGARVGSNIYYAIWVHEGTGIYGRYHRPITPKTKMYLRFKSKGTGSFVYVKSVKGMKPNPFLTDALKAARL